MKGASHTHGDSWMIVAVIVSSISPLPFRVPITSCFVESLDFRFGIGSTILYPYNYRLPDVAASDQEVNHPTVMSSNNVAAVSAFIEGAPPGEVCYCLAS